MLLEPKKKPVLAWEREARLFFKKSWTLLRKWPKSDPKCLKGIPKEPKVTPKAPKVTPMSPKAPQSDSPVAQSAPKVVRKPPKKHPKDT
jgi:hypothetical protein